MQKIAIIGASFGQKELCVKAKELGLYTICFAWEKGALCKEFVDKFYPISILEKDRVANICKKENVDGVVSNASNLTAEIAAYVSEQLGLIGNPYRIIKKIEDKSYCRKATQAISGLSLVDYYFYDGSVHFMPCVIKPKSGGGKSGVSFANDDASFNEAIKYARSASDKDILIEKYVSGHEISVESISYQGKHYVIQITDKENSGPPHFVELGHHQPSSLPNDLKTNIALLVKRILMKIGFRNGASHTELKINDNGEIFLIEVNPRGGGDYISNKLVYLSTGYDYVKAMIDVALGQFEEPIINNKAFSGIYYLCKQTGYLLPKFESTYIRDWIVEKELDHKDLEESKGNSTRNGYLIYKADRKIVLKDE